jgi:uncharacterized protein YcbX
VHKGLDIKYLTEETMSAGSLIGTIAHLQRFPVKSMGADPLQQGDLRWNGLHGDRQYTFVKTNSRNRFPYLTARDVPSLLLYKARYANPSDPRNSGVGVVSPAGVDYNLEDPRLCDELTDAAGEPVQLMQLGRGHFDTAAVSLIAATTAGKVANAHGGGVDLARFRINILVEPTDPDTWDRDWLASTIVINGGAAAARLRVDFPIERCAMITLDPDTAQRDVSIMRTVARAFGNEIGVYCAVQSPGLIRLGDPVHIAG